MKFNHLLAPFAVLSLVVAAGAATTTLDQHKERPKAEKPEGDKHEKKDEKAAKAEDKQDDKAILATQRWSYPLTTCPVSGEKLEAKHVDFVVRGRMVRTCCDHCQADVVKDPTDAFKKIDAAVIAEQKAGYPLTTCPISGEKLGDKAIDKVYGTRLVRFCCDKCAAEFDKDPKTTMTKVDEAYIKAQKDSYPLKKCIVSGEALGSMEGQVDKLYGTTLVRFCCSSCIRTFEKDADKFMKELAEAKKAAK